MASDLQPSLPPEAVRSEFTAPDVEDEPIEDPRSDAEKARKRTYEEEPTEDSRFDAEKGRKLTPEDEHAGQPASPSLAEQLGALTADAMEARLRGFGVALRTPDAAEFVAGYQRRRREELLGGLLAAYRTRPRVETRCEGLS